MKLYKLIFSVVFLCCVTVKGYAQLTADFSADKVEGCAPLIVSFTDLTTGGATNWQWDFGNGNTSVLQKPSVIYANPGVYEVKLIASNASQNSTKVRTAYIKVNAKPTADFSVNKLAACPGSNFSFTDLSTKGTGNITEWQWDFGDGQGSNSTNTSHTYSVQGQYQIRLTIKDANGCSNFKEIATPIVVYPLPQAKILASKTSSCLAPITINFGSETSGATSVNWDFGNGNTSSQSTPSYIFQNSGSYNVKLATISANGCSDTDDVTIVVGNNKANFSMSTSSTCINTSVGFMPDTLGALSYTILFGDGSSNNQTRPIQHAYTTPGVYQVAMIAFFADGCSDTITKQIIVDDVPDVNINYTPQSACVTPFNITFTNPVSNSSSFWQFGDGQTSTQKNVIHTYQTKGPFVVALTVTTNGGCVLTKYDTIEFTPKLEVTSSQDVFCGVSSGNVSFSYLPKYAVPTNPIGHLWRFGDGQTSTQANPTHNYTTEGTFIVKLELSYAGGCVIEGWDTIKIYSYPNVNFVVNLKDVCVKKTINFTNLSTNYDSLIWDFGDKIKEYKKINQPLDGNTTHQYRNPITITKLTDTFDIKLTVFNGPCKKDTTFKDYIRVRAPLAYTEPVTLYCDTPANAVMTDISRYQNPRDSVTRLWVFGDLNADKVGGQPCTVDSKSGINIGRNCNRSVDSIATHIYKQFGTYSAYLKTSSKTTGCIDSFIFDIKVRPKYRLNFTANPDTGCAPLFINLSDTTKTTAKWKWKFNDTSVAPADTAVSKDTAWKYVRPGNYNVVLFGTDTSGCEQTAVKTIVVKGPLANFGITGKLCHPDTTKFTDLTVKTSRIEKWRWSFGDPGSGANNDTSNQQNTQHKFSKLGNFVVSLTVIDSEQCINSIARLVSYGPPKPAYTVNKNTVCQNMGIQFTNTTPGVNTYKWLFGDTTTSIDKNPLHFYADTGQYTVKLIATRNDGCSDSVNTVTVQIVKPKVQFSANNTKAFCPPFTVSFNDSVSADIVSWYWDFGDSSYSSVPNPIKTYNKPGSYTVKLIGTSVGGCSDSIVFTDYIKVGGPIGQFTFTPKNGCVPLDVSFKATTNSAKTHTWDFGDGRVTTSTTDSTLHTYVVSGVFKPVLILTDSNNCSIPYSSPDSVFLLPASKAAFIATDSAICLGGNVLFTDKSITPSGVTVASRHWDFGDLSSSTISPVAHIYTTSGSFDVALSIIDSRGCKDTLVKKAFIQSTLQPTLTITPDTSICLGQSVQLNAAGGIVYRWNPQIGLSDPTIANPIAKPATTTIYKLAAKGAGNCDTAYASVKVTVNGLPFVDAGNDTFLCIGNTVKLQASTSAISYAWQTSTGLSDSSVLNPIAQFNMPTWCMLQVTDTNYCSNFDSVFVDVITPDSTKIIGPEQVCYDAKITLSAQGGDSYLWSQGDVSPAIWAEIKSDTLFWVIPYTKGCKGYADTIQVKIAGDLIDANFTTLSDTLFTHKPIAFYDLSKGAAAYRWNFKYGNLLSQPTSFLPQPIFTYDKSGIYTVQLIVTSTIGCTDTIQKEIVLINNDVFIPNAFSPNGDNLNDFFNFIAADTLYKFEFFVYNRWGQEVFFTKDEQVGWDGTYNGMAAPQDVYVYVFRGDVNNREVVLTGTVTLLR